MALRVIDVDPFGPLIQIGVRVGSAFASAGFGGPPQSYNALIDTGASSTAISPKVVGEVRPQRTGTHPVRRVGATSTADVYDIAIKFEHHLDAGKWHELPVVEVTPATPGPMS